MHILKTLQLPEDPTREGEKTFREACRMVAFDEEGLLPMIFSGRGNYHKLPGGWVDENEDKIDALKREMLEETWCEVEITTELGIIIEESSTHKQTNYCYLGKIIKKGAPLFTSEEVAKGYQLKWFTLQEAITTIHNDTTSSPGGIVLLEREKLILETVRKML